jgi:coenzyme F420-reducing hydrogenase beta subunit
MSTPVSVNFRKDRCSSCGACVQICPQRCIRMQPDADGFYYPQVDAAACLYCGLCRKACHYDASSYHHRLPQPPHYAVARARDDSLRRSGSSGGLFPAMSAWIYETGGLVAGVAFDKDFQALVRLAPDAAAATAFHGSKYVQSRNESAYRDIQVALRQGRHVLFAATPCLVAGLYAYLGESPANLLTVDFICHGTPSAKLFAHYRQWLSQRFGAELRSLHFRDKAKGWGLWLKAEFKDGQVYTPDCLEDPYYHLFLASFSVAPACYRCPYTRAAGREADLSLGDAWKAPQQHPSWDDGSGASVLMANSPAGEKFLSQLTERLDVRPCALELIDQPFLHRPPIAHPDRREFFACWHRHGVERAFRSYARPRPLLRRLKTRLRKIWRALVARGGTA